MQIKADVDYLRKQSIHICMPCYGGQLTESTFMSFIKWSQTANQLGLSWTMETLTNESLISRARNTLAAKFLANEKSTHLLFVDADIGWEPWHLIALLMHDVDLVGGLYPMKTLPIKWVVNGLPGAESNANQLLEVSKTGTGFMLIKRNVFERIDAHPDVVPFVSDIGLDPKYNQHMKTYFDTAVRGGRYYSEDWDFCEKFRDQGGQVFVDKRVMLKHSGTYVFSQENNDALKEQFNK
jgi:hypothetical protein